MSVVHTHPDPGRDGLRRRVRAGGRPLLAVARAGDLFPLAEPLGALLGRGADALREAAARALDGEPLAAPAELLAPVDEQEVWASGVTYRRSATARQEESVVADVYARVYDADRPELFLKAPAVRVPPPGAPLRIRADSAWDVPEPELALVLDAAGELVGYLVADDVSSRSIEGANPLYLPQAKTYDDAVGLSGTIVLAGEAGADRVRSAAITLEISRGGGDVFAGSTSVDEMRRSFEELAEHLFRELSHPAGAVLLTGTGIVPPDDVTLEPGDEVRIEIDGVGILEHAIYRHDRGGAEMMTVITRVELRDGAQAEWDAAMHERLAAAQDQPGWVGGQLLRPLDEHSARVIVGTWASREDWASWHDAEAFRETRQRLEGLQAGAGEMTWHEAIEDRRVD